jgi:2-dehydro-3-deoxyphosphogluconate aldolase/(4S)-4-hydroxy-2-oxoglutarate aldolase
MRIWDPDGRAARVDELLGMAPVLPVLSVSRLEDAVPLARALVEAGLPVLELTLRTDVALAAIRAIRQGVPSAVVGAGTVLDPSALGAVAEAGAEFAISPGATDALYAAAERITLPWIPAAATASEVMRGLEHGHRRFKFFPAEAAGGIGALKAFAGPFPQVRFCPTGGIDAGSAARYLALPNVITLGGSWMVPGPLLAARDWTQIGALARAAAGLRNS